MNELIYLGECEREFIEALLKDGEAVFAPSIARPQGANPKRLGGIVSRLAAAGLIAKAGACLSPLNSRHSGLSHLWKVADRRGLEMRLKFLPRTRRAARQHPKQAVLPFVSEG